MLGEVIYLLVDLDIERGIETQVFDSEEKVVEAFNQLVDRYKEEVVELGSGMITDTWADITDRNDEGISVVHWERKVIN